MMFLTYLMAISATFVVVVGLFVRAQAKEKEIRPGKLDLWYHGLLAAAFWMTILFPSGGTRILVIMVAAAVAAFALKIVEIVREKRRSDAT